MSFEPPSFPPPTPATRPPKPTWWKRRLWKLPTWAWLTIAVVVLLGAAGAAGGDNDGRDGADDRPAETSATTSSDREDAATTAPATEPATVDATTVAETTTTSPANSTTIPVTTTTIPETTTTTTTTTTTVPPTEPPPTLPHFSGGVQVVGEDIQPGRYISSDVSLCYWERLSGLGGGFEDILANDNLDGQAIVDILAGDLAFDSQRCGEWTVYLPPAAPVSSFGEGDWVVNEQILPGLYESEGGGLCYWERVEGFSGTFGDIIANDNVEGRAIVEISSSDAGFSSQRCGTWTLRP